VIVSQTEYVSTTWSGYWGDLLFTGSLYNIPNIHIIITDQRNSHQIYRDITKESIMNIIFNRYDDLYIDPSRGIEILKTLDFYKDNKIIIEDTDNTRLITLIK
jgi:hypothetical protein